MKRPLFLFFLLFITHFAVAGVRGWLFAYFKGNGEDGLHLAYSNDGYNFRALNNDRSFLKPVVGISKLMRDPCIIRTDDGIFHMVWTAGWTEKGIGYASSKDLVNWSEQKYITVMEKEPAAKNCWAPEIFCDKGQKQFIIFWATTIPGRFPDTEKSGDSGYNHRIYYTTTKDFSSFSETRLFYDFGFNVIDATIVQNGKKYIMFLKDETKNPPQKNIRVAVSDNLYGPFSPPSEPVTGKYWAEGPTAIKNGKSWIVYFDKYTEKKMGAIQSSDLQNWADISDRISFPQGTRHGTVFTADKKTLQLLLNN